ncbi:MAG: SDR family NAD(P)-dependent oxidoreductase [Pseudomonadota bacterium]
MRKLSGKRYWLIGASEGLGRAVAFELAKAGAQVVVSARNAERLEELATEIGDGAEAMSVDIASRESVVAAAEKVGEIDGVVFLAGVYWPMKATEWDAEAAETMADINFTGAFRCLGAVVPGMVKRGAGHVVITGSLSGFRGLPGAIGYGATKAGVMSLAETMKFDLKDTGVDVQLINPGFIKTRMTDKNEFNMPFIMEPEAAAELFVRHMRSEKFSLSFPWLFSRFFRGSQFLPDWLYYRVFRM